jgi:hypothetical protein
MRNFGEENAGDQLHFQAARFRPVSELAGDKHEISQVYCQIEMLRHSQKVHKFDNSLFPWPFR